jgi:hypothetical protein
MRRDIAGVRKDPEPSVAGDAAEPRRAIVKAVVSWTAADADHGRAGKLTFEDRQHETPMLLVERRHGIIEDNSLRRMQQNAGKGKPLLLIEGQLIVPPALGVERRSKMLEPHSSEYALESGIVEAPRLGGINSGCTQLAERQVRPLRHEHQGRPRRQLDDTSAPGPQARQGAEQRAPAGTGRADDQEMIPGRQLDLRFVEHGVSLNESHAEIVERDLADRTRDELNVARPLTDRRQRGEHIPEFDHTQQCRPPIGDPREVVENQRSACCT